MFNIYISCVGSFPLSFSRKSVERILIDLYEVGLNYPCYPQLRDFITMFLDPLAAQGLLEKSGLNYLLSAENSRKLRRSEIPVPLEAQWFIESMKRLGFKFRGLRAPVTGPFTLASRIYPVGSSGFLGKTMMKDLTFLKSLASVLSRLIRRLEDLGYTLIVVDEPILSVIYGAKGSILGHSDEDILKVLSMLKPRRAMFGVHVCGRLSPVLFRLLLRSEFSLLDHEFKTSPGNFRSITAEGLRDHGKLLSVGCVSSKNTMVESVEEVSSILAKALSVYGDRVYMVKPDCGFGGFAGFLPEEEAYKISLRKLKVIVEAVKKLNSSI
ncbi:hypothetical protein DRO57_05105 [Candidatus Bathyarchaeota archaeon]|nr:MAG: hypothetical protein DRO57_05105 [Candidatus Bathyarchaeota archaeon]